MSGLKYIPRHKRRQQADRLHGAFAGGFSAGYFNTVGSREGWQPRQQQQQDTGDGDQHNNNNDDISNNITAAQRRRPASKTQLHQQVEDFMDEQDHNEWGGPRKVISELAAGGGGGDGEENTTIIEGNHADAPGASFANPGFLDVALNSSTSAVVPPKNVGQRLLHQLGWRGGNSSSVYVPLPNPPGATTTTTTTRQQGSAVGDSAVETTDQNLNHQEQVFLSKRRLRKIQVQQQRRIQIPAPKLDYVGLGYEAHENAPEFREYFERRQKHQRAKAQGWQQKRNVYRLADVLGDDPISNRATNDGIGDLARRSKNEGTIDASYKDFETAEDFVGTKSVGGFALQEDEDDAFDETKTLTRISDKVQIDQDQYDTVIQDVPSSGDEGSDIEGLKQTNKRNDEKQAKPETKTLGDALAAWATYGTQSNQQHDDTSIQNAARRSARVAFDGRPVLPGFVFPTGDDLSPTAITNMRFRGPDLPENYRIALHVFGPNERPLVLQALARASQLELEDERRQKMIDQALQTATIKAAALSRGKTTTSPDEPEPGRKDQSSVFRSKFEALAQSIKDRFTPAASESTSEPNASSLAAANTQKDGSSASKEKRIIITRTTQRFLPSPLLCKRFRVPVPMHVNGTATEAGADKRRQEEIFFEDTVLKAANSAKLTQPTEAPAKGGHRTNIGDLMDTVVADAQPERPPMEVYRSIFGNNQDDDDDDNVETSSDEAPQDNIENEAAHDHHADAATKADSTEEHETEMPNVGRSHTATLKQQPDKTGDASSSPRGARTEESRKRDWSSDSDSSEERRRERRRKKKRKKEKRSRRDRHRPDSEDDDGSKKRRHRRRSKDRKKSSH